MEVHLKESQRNKYIRNRYNYQLVKLLYLSSYDFENIDEQRPEWPQFNGDSDVGDIVMLVTLWWWPIWNVGGRIIMLATFFVMLVIFPMY